MNQLTQEEAERAAKCCGWERKTGQAQVMWAPGHFGTTDKWWEKDGKWQGVDPHPNFLDPFFWRPRLEDRLKDIVSRRQDWMFELHINQNLHTVWIDCNRPIGEGKDEIEALCSAIESLTGEGK